MAALFWLTQNRVKVIHLRLYYPVSQTQLKITIKNKIMQPNTSFFTLLFSMPGGSEWILIVIVVLLMFGGKKIPELMRGIGKGIREFKDAKGKEALFQYPESITTDEIGNIYVADKNNNCIRKKRLQFFRLNI